MSGSAGNEAAATGEGRVPFGGMRRRDEVRRPCWPLAAQVLSCCVRKASLTFTRPAEYTIADRFERLALELARWRAVQRACAVRVPACVTIFISDVDK